MNRSKRHQVWEYGSPLALSPVCQQRRGSPPPYLASFPAEASAEYGAALTRYDDSLGRILWRLEIAAFALLIALFNLPLFAGVFSTQFIYHPDAVSGGECFSLHRIPCQFQRIVSQIEGFGGRSFSLRSARSCDGSVLVKVCIRVIRDGQ